MRDGCAAGAKSRWMSRGALHASRQGDVILSILTCIAFVTSLTGGCAVPKPADGRTERRAEARQEQLTAAEEVMRGATRKLSFSAVAPAAIHELGRVGWPFDVRLPKPILTGASFSEREGMAVCYSTIAQEDAKSLIAGLMADWADHGWCADGSQGELGVGTTPRLWRNGGRTISALLERTSSPSSCTLVVTTNRVSDSWPVTTSGLVDFAFDPPRSDEE